MMITYIAFLRGINVGGKNKIKMESLRNNLSGLGLSNIKTYIQSGNIIFESQKEEDILVKEIEFEILRVYDMSITVIIRTAEELENIILNCPFAEKEVEKAESVSGVNSLYFRLLPYAISLEDIKIFDSCKNNGDDYKLIGREIFFLFKQSIRDSKIARNLKKIGVPITIRNRKTMNKLNQMVNNRI